MTYNLEMEKCVLSSLLIGADRDIVKSILSVEDFYDSSHKVIYKAILMIPDGDPVDMVTVGDVLHSSGKHEEADMLIDISDIVPSTAKVQSYAKIVKKKSNERKFAINAHKAIQCIENGGGIEEASNIIGTSLFVGDDTNDVDIAEAVQQWVSHILEMKSGGTGIYSGISPLDMMVGGFHDGELIIIAGRPSTGKSSLAFQIANYASVTSSVPGGIFTLEMPAKWVVGRMASQNARVNLFDFAHGNLSTEQWDQVDVELERISRSPIEIHDEPGISVWGIRAKAREWVTKKGVKYILIDYLQLASGVGNSRTEELTSISRGLKQVAREAEIPVICLSQLNRANEVGAVIRPPRLSDLRGSGAIEQDADVVIFVHRNLEDESSELIIGKQRNGPVGSKTVKFEKEFAVFQT